MAALAASRGRPVARKDCAEVWDRRSRERKLWREKGVVEVGKGADCIGRGRVVVRVVREDVRVEHVVEKVVDMGVISKMCAIRAGHRVQQAARRVL